MKTKWWLVIGGVLAVGYVFGDKQPKDPPAEIAAKPPAAAAPAQQASATPQPPVVLAAPA